MCPPRRSGPALAAVSEVNTGHPTMAPSGPTSSAGSWPAQGYVLWVVGVLSEEGYKGPAFQPGFRHVGNSWF